MPRGQRTRLGHGSRRCNRFCSPFNTCKRRCPKLKRVWRHTAWGNFVRRGGSALLSPIQIDQEQLQDVTSH